MRNNECVYCIVPVVSSVEVLAGVSPDLVKPYKIDDKSINQLIELKHGKSVKLFMMDKVSNSVFNQVGAQLSLSFFFLSMTQKEFERVQKACQTEGVKLPTKAQIEIKCAQLARLATQPMTEVGFFSST